MNYTVQADYRLVNVALCRRRIPMQGLPQLAGVDPAPPPVEDVPGQGVELLDFEQAAPDPAAQFRLREVLRRMNSVLKIRPRSRLAR